MRDEDLKREVLAALLPLARLANSCANDGINWDIHTATGELSAEDCRRARDLHARLSAEPTASAEATEREGVAPVVAKHLPLRINEHTSSTIITAAGDRISVSWSDTRLENPHSEAEAFAAFIVEACNAYAALRHQTPALVSSDPASDTQVSDGTVARWQPIETAPRDGTPILARNHRAEAVPVVVRWITELLDIDYEPHWGDAATACGTALYYNGRYFAHWMPLPALPAAPSEKEPG